MIYTDVLIIGAGASGLMAAKTIAVSGKKVILLEARNRAGGRIDTLLKKDFTQPAEAGAEFVHGNLPLTLQLLKEHKIEYIEAAGSMLRKANGKWQENEEQIDGWDEMLEKMNALKNDMTLSDFLNTFFADEKHIQLRKSALQYAHGFDVADERNASVLALCKEWQHEEEAQYRLPKGYIQLVDALVSDCLQNHCEIHFSEVVKKVKWTKNNVLVTTETNEIFIADKLIVTIPISLLQQEFIAFSPAVTSQINAAKQIGFGTVIKVLLQFENAFWTAIKKDALFFFSEETIPVWWTQFPEKSSLLTGWLGGPDANSLHTNTDEEILQKSLESLANMFDKSIAELQTILQAWHIANWQKEDYALGAYSYQTVQSADAINILKKPVEDTIYFAGEAIYSGAAPGTAEAALASGKEAAEAVLKE